MIDSKVVNTINPNRTEFPKLMIGTSGVVVLFTNPMCGTVVSAGRSLIGSQIGDHLRTFDPVRFTNFNGKVELSNV